MKEEEERKKERQELGSAEGRKEERKEGRKEVRKEGSMQARKSFSKKDGREWNVEGYKVRTV